MASPMPNSSNKIGNKIGTSVANHSSTYSLPNNFSMSADGKSATKPVKEDNKEFIFTVYFPQSLYSDTNMTSRSDFLNQYTDDKVQQAIKLAVVCGLGINPELTKVSFEQDEKGNLETATKHFFDKKTELIDKKYFKSLKEKYSNDTARLKKVNEFEETFEKTRSAWMSLRKTFAAPLLKPTPTEISPKPPVDNTAILNKLESLRLMRNKKGTEVISVIKKYIGNSADLEREIKEVVYNSSKFSGDQLLKCCAKFRTNKKEIEFEDAEMEEGLLKSAWNDYNNAKKEYTIEMVKHFKKEHIGSLQKFFMSNPDATVHDFQNYLIEIL